MRRALLLMVLLFSAAGPAHAGMQVVISLDRDAKAKVALECCYQNSLPPSGYAPINVTITNSSGAPQEWNFRFSSPAFQGSAAATSYSTTVAVENNATRTVPLLVPLGHLPVGASGIPYLGVSVQGYGAAGGTVQMFGGGGTAAGHPNSRYVVISESLGAIEWSKLEVALNSTWHKDLTGSTLAPDRFPEDWRALAGVSAVWLSESELGQLSPAQRGALSTWVRMGGALELCGAEKIPADFDPAGFGQVTMLPLALDVNATARTINNLYAVKSGILSGAPDAKAAGLRPVTPNVLGLGLFMGLFAVVVGPVNIFLLAGERRRQRLFWTTPVISLLASAGLGGIILLEDGVGGSGVRTAFVYLAPHERQAIVLQGQTSRTGLLLGSRFQTRDPVVIEEQVSGSASGNVGRSLENDGTFFNGGWFTSRSIQTQQIASVVPTRAEITLLNPAETRNQGVPPVILSSFPAPLNELIYTDAGGRRWRGENLRTGEKQTLIPAGQSGAAFPGSYSGAAHLYTDAGTFYATGNDPSFLTATLPSIRWQNRTVTYFGPVTQP